MAEECRSCGASIDWAFAPEPDENGKVKSNPIDHGSADDPHGNLIVWRDKTGVLRFRYKRKGVALGPGEHTGISHFATCRQADQWRGGRSRTTPDASGHQRDNSWPPGSNGEAASR